MVIVEFANDKGLEIELCHEQKLLGNLAVEGNNVFHANSAGCGMSIILRALVPKLRGLGRRVSLMALTGRAALDIIGCMTINLAGWTLDNLKEALEDLIKLAATDRVVKERLRKIDLVTDEILMVERQFFERLVASSKAAEGTAHLSAECNSWPPFQY